MRRVCTTIPTLIWTLQAFEKEIEMTHDNDREGKPVSYWIMLGIMFTAFLVVAAS
jgi:hypothetical protein